MYDYSYSSWDPMGSHGILSSRTHIFHTKKNIRSIIETCGKSSYVWHLRLWNKHMFVWKLRLPCHFPSASGRLLLVAISFCSLDFSNRNEVPISHCVLVPVVSAGCHERSVVNWLQGSESPWWGQMHHHCHWTQGNNWWIHYVHWHHGLCRVWLVIPHHVHLI